MTPQMTSAELRARLEHLGLNPRSFSMLTGRDERDLRRMIAGKLPISNPTVTSLVDLEARAEDTLAHWDLATGDGVPILIPEQDTPQTPGDYPARWYLALAGRHIAEWGADAQIEWAPTVF